MTMNKFTAGQRPMKKVNITEESMIGIKTLILEYLSRFRGIKKYMNDWQNTFRA
jgi:hypothetical protein